VSRRTPVKAPNPFGEVSRDGGTQPPAVSAPTSTAFQPLTHTVVSGQTRETHRAYGHVLSEQGWKKELTADD
jgi:hypothetical protein